MSPPAGRRGQCPQASLVHGYYDGPPLGGSVLEPAALALRDFQGMVREFRGDIDVAVATFQAMAVAGFVVDAALRRAASPGQFNSFTRSVSGGATGLNVPR